MESILINNDAILQIIRGLNPGKASGPDGISSRMLIISDQSVVLPLKIIFTNAIANGLYPDIWKLANVTPIHKKSDKQDIKNYRPTSLLPICSKVFEKIIVKNSRA